jgi:hypothetical protein
MKMKIHEKNPLVGARQRTRDGKVGSVLDSVPAKLATLPKPLPLEFRLMSALLPHTSLFSATAYGTARTYTADGGNVRRRLNVQRCVQAVVAVIFSWNRKRGQKDDLRATLPAHEKEKRLVHISPFCLGCRHSLT